MNLIELSILEIVMVNGYLFTLDTNSNHNKPLHLHFS